MTDITAELAATCAALGFFDGIQYHLDTHCLGTSVGKFIFVAITRKSLFNKKQILI